MKDQSHFCAKLRRLHAFGVYELYIGYHTS